MKVRATVRWSLFGERCPTWIRRMAFVKRERAG